MAIIFREYRKEDKKLLIELGNKLEEYQKSIDPIKRVQNLQGFTEQDLDETFEDIRKNQGKIWFAEDGGKSIGFCGGNCLEPN